MNVIPIALIGILAAILAFDKRYEDGLIGHISLACIVVASIIITFGPLFGEYEYSFPPEMKVLLWATLGCLIRHTWRSYRGRIYGAHDWSKQSAKE